MIFKNKEEDCSDMERNETDGADGGNEGFFEIPKSKDKVIEKLKLPEKSYLKFLDMRHLLGFLNQSEWVSTLNIGNIMQVSPI